MMLKWDKSCKMTHLLCQFPALNFLAEMILASTEAERNSRDAASPRFKLLEST
jgi:hypothetical protein